MNDALLNVLRSVDTPTVCNAIEAAQGKRGFNNFTKATMVASAPEEKSVVGYALTAKIAATSAPEESTESLKERRMAYYKYMAEGQRPSVAVIEDCDFPNCVGAFWGEINTTVHNIIRNYVREENIYRGKNIIIVETVKEYVKKVIELDKRTLEKGNELKIIAVEKEFEDEIKEGRKKYKIRGKIDRIDELNGDVRVIDYKSGKKISKRNLTIKNSEELTKEKGIYNLQLLIYILGIRGEFNEKIIKSGIINLKNIRDGVLEGVFNGNTALSNNEMENYKKEIIMIITNILDKNKLFKN